MIQDKTPDCFIEQYQRIEDETQAFEVHSTPFIPFYYTIAVTKVYLKESYKKQLENEFHYTY